MRIASRGEEICFRWAHPFAQGGGFRGRYCTLYVHTHARYYIIVDPHTFSLMYGLPGARRVQPLVHRLLWRIYVEIRQICARGASYCVAKCRLFDGGNCSGATGYSKLVDDRRYCSRVTWQSHNSGCRSSVVRYAARSAKITLYPRCLPPVEGET